MVSQGPPQRRPGLARRTVGAVVRGLGVAYRQVVTRGALLMIGIWAAAAALVPGYLGVQPDTAGFGTSLPSHGEAVAVEQASLRLFSVPVLSNTSVVVSNPHGLSALTRADIVAYAARYLQHRNDAAHASSDEPRILAAVPVPSGTPRVAVTYLYFTSSPSPDQAVYLADQYAAHFQRYPGVKTYVTGLLPAEASQQKQLASRLDLFGVLSIVLVAVIVAITFRSLLPPIVVLAVAAVAYLVAQPLLRLLAHVLGFPLPEQVQPLVIALLLGVVTDYSVLQFSEMRDQVRQGFNHGDAVRRTLRRNGQVVAVAGLTVIGGTIALLAANLQLFRAFGPALALTVLVGVAVSLTFTPAIMTILGRRLFRLRGGPVGSASASEGRAHVARLLVRPLSRRLGAIVALPLVGAGLVLAAAPLRHMRLDVSFTDGLPSDDPVQQGTAVLARSSVQGITGPTEVVVFGNGVTSRRTELARFQQEVNAEPEVAQVLGPADNPLRRDFGIFLAKNGSAARLVVVLHHDPLSADAIANLRRLQRALPRLAAQAGLTGTSVGVTGQTAIASELAALTRENLRITLGVAAGVDVVILALFLRALITPFLLIICSGLGVAATLGITTWFFQDVVGDSGLTFYVAFAVAVLLLALGSDYNVFTVGTIWEEARRQRLREALRSAVPRSSRAITAAGLTLAATLGMVAVIPLESSRQVAFAMALGLVIDTLIVRPVLTPAVLALLGRLSGWPGDRIKTHRSHPYLPGAGVAPPDSVPVMGGGGGPV